MGGLHCSHPHRPLTMHRGAANGRRPGEVRPIRFNFEETEAIMSASTRNIARTPMARRRVLAAPLTLLAAGGAAATLAACAAEEEVAAQFGVTSERPPTQVLPSQLPELSARMSEGAWEFSRLVVLADPASSTSMAQVAASVRAPLLVAAPPLSDGDATLTELTRLGAQHVIAPTGMDTSELIAALDNPEVSEVDPANPDLSGLKREFDNAQDTQPAFALMVLTGDDSEETGLARAIAEAYRIPVHEVAVADVRATGHSVESAKQAIAAASGEAEASTGVFAVGPEFGSTEQFSAQLAAATTAPELPGGGQVLVPYRRMVAAYGSPNTPSLGILGEQDLQASIARTKELAAQYQPLEELPVVPSFEIIATVASASAGADGMYSAVVDKDLLREWVDAAGEEGVYVVLDLQPGRNHFLDQARLFEDLLKEPHVGLALDPEWRLKPDQVHLRQIGRVEASEINEVSEWLADLTRSNNLPQKALVLHQFTMAMIQNRQDLNTSHHELAFILHADGHGTPGEKMGTWRALQEGLPENVHMAWKNFYDEDTPTFTPEETYAVEPRPWFVSYQ